MLGIRHEQYGNFPHDYPLSLGLDLERTPYNGTHEQNWHDNPEIQLCTEGSGTVLLDGEAFDFSPGDIITISPGVIHYTSTDRYLKYTCLILSTDWCRQMHFPLDSIFFSPRIQSDTVREIIAEMGRTYGDEHDPLRTLKLNAQLSRLMIHLTEHHLRTSPLPAAGSRKFHTIKSAIIHIRQHYREKLTLAEIAAAVLTDKYTLCKEFKRFTGKTVIGYLHEYRCLRAMELLTSGSTVSEAAARCGFENLSYFTRIFRRCIGQNPSACKRL